MAAPLPEDEDARLAALREYAVLDTETEVTYDEIVRLAAFICGTPIAAITVVDADRQWFKSSLGLDFQETPRDMAFCAHTILHSGVMIVPDATQDPRFADNPLVIGDPNIRFYAGVPLVTGSGHALGSLCVIDRVPRHLTPEQQASLQTLSHQVVNNLQMVWEAKRRIKDEDVLRQLGGAVASVVEGIVVTDAGRFDRPLIYVNPAFLSLTGYTESEVLGRNCRFLQGEDTDPDAKRQIRAALAAGSVCRVILRNYKKDGTAFWNDLSISPVLDTSGLLTHFVGVQHDITALKEAENAARQKEARLAEKEARLVEAQRIGGTGDWELDLATLKMTWSAEMFRLTEFDPALGEPSYDLVQARYAPDDRAERGRQFAQALKTGEPYQCDLRLLLPSGTPRWCHLIGQPILNADGQVVRVAGTVLDITERKEREQQVQDASLVLQVQKVQLEAANVELAALVITDPLTGLLNYRAFQARLAQEVKNTRQEGHTAAVALLDIDNFRFFNDTYGHALGDAVLRQVASKLAAACSARDAVAHFGGDEFSVMLPGIAATTTPAEVEARLQAGLTALFFQPPGEASAIPITLSIGAALLPLDETPDDTTRAEALQRAEERLRRAKTGADAETSADRIRTQVGRSLSGFSMLDALVTAVDNKDRYTRKHSEDVMEYSLMIAHGLGLDEITKNTIAIAALLHDVGKIGIPDAILRKPGKLTDEEFEAVKQHPMMGAVMVGAVPGLEKTLDAVRHHHEQWDGGGYPFGLRGEETALLARLMAVADAYSAMTTDRPYRKGMDPEKALSILENGAGTQWDPECVRVFLTALQK
jgi:diguanylate cyclase (GGDEF)-like protein/PAS domain S-box-containing protein